STFAACRRADAKLASAPMATSISQPRSRGIFLTVMTILFVLLAISDFSKPLQFHGNPERGGLVVLGYKLQGVVLNAIGGTAFGVFLMLYASGIWRMKSWVLPLAIVYALYVPVNLVMFWFLHTEPRPTIGFIAFYLFLSVGGSVGTALYLTYHRD